MQEAKSIKKDEGRGERGREVDSGNNIHFDSG